MFLRRLAALAVALPLLVSCGGTGQPPEAKSTTSSASPGPASPAASSSATPDSADADGSLVPEGLETRAPTTHTTKGRRIFGADVSWPQCPRGMGIKYKETLGAPMPTDAARFVIIGLTNGPSFTPNPCLADQVAWARQRKLLTAAYAVLSWPDQARVDELGTTGPYGVSRLDQLRNVGHQAATYTIRQMQGAGLKSPIIWVDVEPVNHYAWAGTTEEQAAVVEGTVRGYRDAGRRVGVYSTPAMYRNIVGDLKLNDPEWRAAGQTSMAEALSRCGRDWSIAGGQAVFGQWVEDGRDRNVTCPGVDLNLDEYFQQF